MESFLKVLGVIILILILSPVIFIGEESIRLQKNKRAMPLVILSEDVNVETGEEGETSEVERVLNSIGFSLHVRVLEEEKSSDNVVGIIIGEEFWLFNSILIWGYIE